MGTNEKTPTQTVYLIEHPKGYVKIGTSENPERRLKSIQPGSPYQLKVRTTITGVNDSDGNPRTVEGALHTFYGNDRIRSEWFDIPEREREALEDIDVIRLSDIMAGRLRLEFNDPPDIRGLLRATQALHYQPNKATPAK